VMATHDLLSAALDQSSIVQTVPRSLIRQALLAAGKPGNARLDAELAREIAYRSSVRAVLEGKVGRLGSAYTIVVDVVNADSGKVILNRSVTAKDEQALIGAVEDLARQLRKGLGENSAALRATRGMNLVMTPSFEAYRLFAQGARLSTQGSGIRRSLASWRAALAVDTAFASAWVAMSVQFSNLGYPDSVRYCIAQAYRHPERLTEGQKQALERTRLGNDGDTRGMLALYDRIIEEDPSNYNVLANSNDALLGVGRIEDALDRTRRAMTLSPFGPSELMRINLSFDLMWLGRFDEAREAARRQTGNWKAWTYACIEIAAGDWAVAESIGVANLDDRTIQADLPALFRYTRSIARFARGGLHAAAADMVTVIDEARAAPDPASVEIYQRCAILLSDVSGRLAPLPPELSARDTGLAFVMSRGLRAAVAGDADAAEACLAAVRRSPAGHLAVVGVSPAVLEARVALLGGRPEEAIRLMRPLAALRIEPGYPMNGLGLNWTRWVLADAFERTSRPDSAAACLESALVAPSVMSDAIQRPFMRHRLVGLYARMGRLPDAERHLAALEKDWDRPDPEVRRLLDQDRTLVRGTRGVAGQERAKR
jgi:tetratricopeptide (TPR) repeat protein